jgi:peptidoglycan/xylan/chitin deacetylase (PgdA/CDA1 family)
MKAIMYHYVRPYDENFPFFKNLNIEDFCRQLDYFQEKFGFVSKEDFINSFKIGVPPNGVILTFDDGLKCHYKYVFEELRRRDLWGIFYISTKPYQTKKILDVHRIHLLLGHVESNILYDYLKTLIQEEMLIDKLRIEFRELTYVDQDNDYYTQLIKRILNYYIAYEYRENVIDKLMDKFISNSINTVDSFYLTSNEMKEMQNEGMIFGSHTVSHSVMSKLTLTEQTNEIINSFDFLEQELSESKYKTFCYPYGGFHTFSKETEEILKQNNCLFSFNVEHRDITSSDILERPQALPRYDCNFFEYGKCR